MSNAATAEKIMPEVASDGEQEEKKRGRRKPKKVKEKKKGGRLKKVLALFLIVLLIAAGVCVYLILVHNWLSGRDTVIGFLASFDPEYRGYMKKIEEAEDALQIRSAGADARETALSEREDALSERELSLDQRELDIARQETLSGLGQGVVAEKSVTFEAYMIGLSDNKLAELKKTGNIYSKMDAAEAAAIISEIKDETEMALVIYHMTPATAAAALAELPAEAAARITKKIIS